MDRAPWHLWLVGALALISNIGSAVDFTATQLGILAYLDQVPPVQVAWIKAAPLWFHIAWGVAAWSAVLGAIALLARRKSAVWLFALALVGMGVSALYSLVLANPPMTDLMGQGALVFTGLVVASYVVFWVYARRMAEAFVIR